jgi:hypothetical protein
MNSVNGIDDIKYQVIALLIFIALLFILKFFTATHDYNVWNYGYCECGGKWVYQQAVGHYYSTDYIYKCDKCGKIHEFDEMR